MGRKRVPPCSVEQTGASMKTRQYVYLGLLAFLGFAIFFSTFRRPIAAVNSWILTISGDLRVKDLNTSSGVQSVSPKELAASSFGVKAPATAATPTKTAAVQVQKDFKLEVPQTTNLPKTDQPVAPFVEKDPPMDGGSLPLAPKMRKFDGTEWDLERTDLRMATNGKCWFIICKCYDKDPRGIITKNSEAGGSGAAFQDDSIEVFLRKDKSSDGYVQYVSSASGKSHVYRIKVPENGDPRAIGATDTSGKEFVAPVFDIRRDDDGFTVYMKIDLSNIGAKRLLVPGEEILVQVVRNYRGQGTATSATLQLFPAHIYADNRYGYNNHDRRGFQPVKIVTTDSAADDQDENREANK